jgi:hypothetical protein
LSLVDPAGSVPGPSASAGPVPEWSLPGLPLQAEPEPEGSLQGPEGVAAQPAASSAYPACSQVVACPRLSLRAVLRQGLVLLRR